jgi:hypothetical protein
MNLAGKPFERVFGNGDQGRMQVEWLSGLRHVIIHVFDLQPSETHDPRLIVSRKSASGRCYAKVCTVGFDIAVPNLRTFCSAPESLITAGGCSWCLSGSDR